MTHNLQLNEEAHSGGTVGNPAFLLYVEIAGMASQLKKSPTADEIIRNSCNETESLMRKVTRSSHPEQFLEEVRANDHIIRSVEHFFIDTSLNYNIPPDERANYCSLFWNHYENLQQFYDPGSFNELLFLVERMNLDKYRN